MEYDVVALPSHELTDAIASMVEEGLKVKAVELTGDWADVRDPEVVESLNQG